MADTRTVALTARLAAAHDALSRLGFDVAAGCLGIIVCSYCYEVVSRYFFNAPTIWAGPLVSYMLCALVFLAAPDITRKNTHIVINVVQEKMSPKHVAYLQKFIAAVSAAACLVGVWIVGATVISQYIAGHRDHSDLGHSEMAAVGNDRLRLAVVRDPFFATSREWRRFPRIYGGGVVT